MKKIFIALMLLCSNSFAAITDGKFGINQIFDVQYWWNGTTLNASSFIAPYNMNFQTVTASAGQYFQFFPSTTNPGKYGLGLYNSNGTLAQVVHNHGDITALGNGAIFYIGSGFFGNVISTAQGYNYGASAQFTNMDTSVSASDLSSYTFASTTPLAAGQTAAPAAPVVTVTGTSTSYTTRNVVSGNTTTVYRTPVTTTTYSNGTSTSVNGTEALYQTRVASAVVTNKIVGSTLTTYSTPVIKVTPAGGASSIEANGAQTATTQTVQTGLNFEVWRYDPKNYNCFLGICAWNFTYHTPSTNRNNYSNPVNSGRTSNGVFTATNSDLPNNDNSLIGANDGTVIRYQGTITAPVTATKPAGTVYRLYFYNNTDDGFVLRINGGTIINQNDTERLQAIVGTTSNGWMDVVAGQTYNLEAWYWNTWGGFGNTFYWDYGDGLKPIYNNSFTTGTISNIDIDLTGLSYSDPNVVPTSGTPMSLLCCGGSAEPFNADLNNVAKVNAFANRTTNDSRVYIEQIGNMNTITVDQSGTKNNYVNYVGNGSSNQVTITQSGTSNTTVNYADVGITGNSNSVSITQSSTGGAKGAFVSIQDNNNSVIIQQKDSGNHYAEITLSGGNKNVDVLQQGSASHMARINLSGLPQDLSLTQSGSTQQYYSITSNCATAGGCAKITVNQGQ